MYLFLQCNRWRIAAAAAAAAAAAFEEVGIFPLCGGNGFPMHARMFDLRFNVVRILWTLVVIFRNRLGRFEGTSYRSSLPSCAILNRNSPSTNYQNSFGNSPEYSMMVLALGDNSGFFMQFELVNNRRMYSFFRWCFSWGLWQCNDASVTAHELLDNEFFIRARII